MLDEEHEEDDCQDEAAERYDVRNGENLVRRVVGSANRTQILPGFLLRKNFGCDLRLCAAFYLFPQ
jgi:hypothetical protein